MYFSLDAPSTALPLVLMITLASVKLQEAALAIDAHARAAVVSVERSKRIFEYGVHCEQYTKCLLLYFAKGVFRGIPMDSSNPGSHASTDHQALLELILRCTQATSVNSSSSIR